MMFEMPCPELKLPGCASSLACFRSAVSEVSGRKSGVEKSNAVAKQKTSGDEQLSSGVLSRLPWSVLEDALPLLSSSDVAALSAACRETQPLVEDPLYWKFQSSKRVELGGIDVPHRDFCRIVAESKDVSCNLISTVKACSSQDQEDESPLNTLEASTCFTSGCSRQTPVFVYPDQPSLAPRVKALRMQFQCGCGRGQPCYWSTSPNSDPASIDSITYGLASGVSVVKSFSVTPYCAFWHPDQPTYAPMSARLRFTHPNGETYYVSPAFPVRQMMELQKFNLPLPVLFVGGEVTIELIGKQQRQTLGPDAGTSANDYYTCLSHVAISGVALGDFVYNEKEARVLRH